MTESRDERDRLLTRSSIIGLGIGGIAYFLVLFNFSTNPLRTAVRQGFASNFFDLQAQAFMHGRLSVPTGSLGIEGFVVRGKTYIYYPPFPALIRVPVMLVTHEFDGRLTLLSMAIAWLVFAVMTTKLYWLVRRCIRPGVSLSRWEAAISAIFLATATGGSVVVFDGALPWVYNEVYLWAMAAVVGALYWLVRASLDPTSTSIGWLAAFALASIWTRTTGGWAVSVAAIAVGIWLASKSHPDRRWSRWAVIAAGVFPLLAGIGFNYAKFRHPYLFPLQDQVWTSVNARRRQALSVNGGTLTGPQFLPTSIVNYLRPNGIRFVGYFPYITLPAGPAKAYAGAFVDQSYRTGSVTCFMPMMLLLSMWGCLAVFRRRVAYPIRNLRIPVLGAAAVTIGVMDYGYVTHRYISEFIPFLVLAGAIGACDVCRLMSDRGRFARHAAVAVIAALGTFGVLANSATAITIAEQTDRGTKLRQYVETQYALSKQALKPMISRSETLPKTGRTDELRIVGDCAGLYLNTGDQYEQWIVVQARERTVQVSVGQGRMRDELVPVLTVQGNVPRSIELETSTAQRARFVVVDGTDRQNGPWFNAPPSQSVLLLLRPDTSIGQTELFTSPGGFAGYVPLADWDSDWISKPNVVEPAPSSGSIRTDVSLSYGWGPPPTLCQKLATAAGISIDGPP